MINTARGSLLDHDALLAEVKSGRLYAVLDVTDPEPLPEDHPLWAAPNAFITPHLAGSQGTELRLMTDYVVDEITRWSAGESERNSQGTIRPIGLRNAATPWQLRGGGESCDPMKSCAPRRRRHRYAPRARGDTSATELCRQLRRVHHEL